MPTASHDRVVNPLRYRLEPGERVLWEGQPDVSAFSLRGAWYLIPFSLVWTGFALFWEATALAAGAPPLFALWGLPFIGIGLYLVVGRLVVAVREAHRTFYAITDRRVLLLTGPFSQRLTQLDLVDLPPAQLEERTSGVGTISFGGAINSFRPPPGWPTLGMYGQIPAFVSIDDASRVYRLIHDAKAAARGQ